MKRLHLFEFEDQAWFPDVIRKGITDYLDFFAKSVSLYKPIIPILKSGIEKSKSNKIIDLCSGGGGGFSRISEQLSSENLQAKIILTDKYPNLSAYSKIANESNGRIEYVETPVDATAVPENLNGFRTMFVSFHHFRPEVAQKILEDAANKNMPIAIFEWTERTLLNFISMMFGPVVILLATPFIRPLTFKKLFFTYIIPAIPFCLMWDGMVSVLRTYSQKELKEMTEKIGAKNYKWEIGREKVNASLGILYLFGYPEQ